MKLPIDINVSVCCGEHQVLKAPSVIVDLPVTYVMSWAPFAVTIPEGAQRVANVCTGQEKRAATGKYYAKGIQTASSDDSHDSTKMHQLWELSLKATNIGDYIPKTQP